MNFELFLNTGDNDANVFAAIAQSSVRHKMHVAYFRLQIYTYVVISGLKDEPNEKELHSMYARFSGNTFLFDLHLCSV